MKKLSTFVHGLLIVAAAVAAPTANEDFVIAEDAQTYTNAVNYADGVASLLQGDIARKASYYKYEGGAASNILVSCDWWHTGVSILLAEDEDEGRIYWWGEKRRPHTLGGISYRLEYQDVGWLYREGSGSTGRTSFITNHQDRVATVLDFGSFTLTRTNEVWAVGTNRWPVVYADELASATPGDYETVSNRAMSALQSHQSLADYYTKGQTDARIVELAPTPGDYETVSNRAMSALQSFDEEDPTVSEWAKSANKPSYTASEVGAYSSTAGNTLAGQVATIGAHLNAEDARFVVTNYNSVANTPEAYVEIKLPDESWSRIWSEMTRWNYLFDYYLPTNYYDKAAVNAALAEKADRAWGFYDSTTGAYAPYGYTWISSEKIAIAANLAYQRTVTTEGSIWVLESNGVVTETGGMTNGFFRISDDEGNSLFEIVKGNKRTVGADASSCQVVAGFTPTKLQIGYSIVSDVHPTLYVCQSLATQNWKAETDSDCIATVTWSGTSGAYVAQVQGKSAYSLMFVKATYEVGGETYINNSAPVSMQYIMLNGVKYAVGVGTVSGTTVLTLTVAP